MTTRVKISNLASSSGFARVTVKTPDGNSYNLVTLPAGHTYETDVYGQTEFIVTEIVDRRKQPPAVSPWNKRYNDVLEPDDYRSSQV